jgi:hypothetical protein
MTGAEPAAGKAAASALGAELAPVAAAEVFPVVMSAGPELIGIAEGAGPLLSVATGAELGAAAGLPFGLTGTDLLLGGLRGAQYLMERSAYDDAADRANALTRQMMDDQRNYTERAIGEVQNVAENFDPKAYLGDYTEAAGKKSQSISEALSQAAPDVASAGSTGALSDRYRDVTRQTGEREAARIQTIAQLLGGLGAHQDVAQTNAIRGLLSQVNLGNIGSDRRSAMGLGQTEMMGIEPSGTRLGAAQLLGLGADLVPLGQAKGRQKTKTQLL